MAKRQRARGAGEAAVPPAQSSSERERLEAAVASFPASMPTSSASSGETIWAGRSRPSSGMAPRARARLSDPGRGIRGSRPGDLAPSARDEGGSPIGQARPFANRGPTTREGVGLSSGALLVREWNGRIERVMVLDEGYAWNGGVYSSLSQAAKAITGTNWNGHRFFGLKRVRNAISRRKGIAAPTSNAALGTGVSHPSQAQIVQEVRR